jgi:hypothetical protein
MPSKNFTFFLFVFCIIHNFLIHSWSVCVLLVRKFFYTNVKGKIIFEDVIELVYKTKGQF